MYGLIINNEIWAVHDDIEVIETYLNDYEYYHGQIENSIVKIKKKKEKLYDDLFLEPIGNTFIQSKYIETYKAVLENQIETDYRRCKHILYRLVSEEELGKSEKKNIRKVIEILEKREDETKSYLPSKEELKEFNIHYEQMLNHIYDR